MGKKEAEEIAMEELRCRAENFADQYLRCPGQKQRGIAKPPGYEAKTHPLFDEPALPTLN